MQDNTTSKMVTQIARGIARQFGQNCEVVVHRLDLKSKNSKIVYIENGHVSDRKLGDGPSHIVLEALKKNPETLEDKLNYLTKSHDGRILKSSTIFIRNGDDEVEYIMAINFDITGLLAVEGSINSITSTQMPGQADNDVEKIPVNINELLDELIEHSIRLVGKPPAIMSKDEKIKAIEFLNNTGALLITKSGDKISKTFNISKYTLYNYLDAASKQ